MAKKQFIAPIVTNGVLLDMRICKRKRVKFAYCNMQVKLMKVKRLDESEKIRREEVKKFKALYGKRPRPRKSRSKKVKVEIPTIFTVVHEDGTEERM